MFKYKNLLSLREIIELRNISIVNQSYIKNNKTKLQENLDFYNINNLIYLDKNSNSIPDVFIKVFKDATNLDDLIYINDFYSILGCQHNLIYLNYLLKNEYIEIIELKNLNFLKYIKILNSEIKEILTKNYCYYTTSKEEADEMLKNKEIIGYIKITHKKYLTYY